MNNQHRASSIQHNLAIILVSTVFTVSCHQQFEEHVGKQSKIVITGSSTIAPLINEIGKRFELLNPDVRIDVQTGGSSRGISDARQGLADIGMISRAPNPDEQDLQWVPLAEDGIAMIVHKGNRIDSLSDDEIISIYLGKITNWEEVGGPDSTITVVNKAEGRSTLEVFLKHFHLSVPNIKAHVIIGDNQQAIKTVAGNPAAIAYVSIGSAEFEAMHGSPIHLLPSNGVVASVENVRNGSYPISRTLNLVTPISSSESVREFVAFCQSDQVVQPIREQFFVQAKN